jgi:hypothetical protein
MSGSTSFGKKGYPAIDPTADADVSPSSESDETRKSEKKLKKQADAKAKAEAKAAKAAAKAAAKEKSKEVNSRYLSHKAITLN